MIPVRMGSQRLREKNLKEINGESLLALAIRKCVQAKVFDEIWVNSESDVLGKIAQDAGVNFYKRPTVLANNQATSEGFVADFLTHRSCEYLIQVHSIAPLLSIGEIIRFVEHIKKGDVSTLLSVEDIQIECVYGEKPVNFRFGEKTNSQDLQPIRRISWSITGWSRTSYLNAFKSGLCATYSGQIGYFQLSKLASHVIKVEEDLRIAELLLPIIDTK